MLTNTGGTPPDYFEGFAIAVVTRDAENVSLGTIFSGAEARKGGPTQTVRIDSWAALFD